MRYRSTVFLVLFTQRCLVSFGVQLQVSQVLEESTLSFCETSQDCEVSQFCKGRRRQKCANRRKSGQICRLDEECLTGVCESVEGSRRTRCTCNSHSQCIDPKRPTCSELGRCEPARCDNGGLSCSDTEYCNRRGQCQRKRRNRNRCSESAECESGLCSNRRCLACSTHEDCTGDKTKTVGTRMCSVSGECICAPGWKGQLCDKSTPCPANSLGKSKPDGCKCKAGFQALKTTGTNIVEACSPVVCPKHSTGVNVVEGCRCASGYSGDLTPTDEPPYVKQLCTKTVEPTASPTRKPSYAPSSAPTDPKGCIDDLGDFHLIGATWLGDDCSRCTCHSDGRFFCTKPTPPTCSNGEVPVLDSETCKYSACKPPVMSLLVKGMTCEPKDSIFTLMGVDLHACKSKCLAMGPEKCNFLAFYDGLFAICEFYSKCELSHRAIRDVYKRETLDKCKGLTCFYSHGGSQCSDRGTCNPETGMCSSFVPKPAGVSCHISNSRYVNHQCTGRGYCSGSCDREVTCSGHGTCRNRMCSCDVGYLSTWCDVELCDKHKDDLDCRANACRSEPRCVPKLMQKPSWALQEAYPACEYTLKDPGTPCTLQDGGQGKCSHQCPEYTNTNDKHINPPIDNIVVRGGAEECRNRCNMNRNCGFWSLVHNSCMIYQAGAFYAREQGTTSGPRCSPGECYSDPAFICLTSEAGTVCGEEKLCHENECRPKGDYICATEVPGTVCGTDAVGEMTCQGGVCVGQTPKMILIASSGYHTCGPGSGPSMYNSVSSVHMCNSLCLANPSCRYSLMAGPFCVTLSQCKMSNRAFHNIYRKSSSNMCEFTTCLPGKTCQATSGMCM